MSVIIVVVLHQFLVLDVTVLLLNSVQLVSKGNIVLVTLLNLEDLSLELTDKEILLVACQVDRIVILEVIRGCKKYLLWPSLILFLSYSCLESD